MGTGRVFFRSREGLESPDAMLSIIPYIPMLDEGKRKISPVRGVSMFAHTQRTESTGSIHIKSDRPEDEPDWRRGTWLHALNNTFAAFF